MAVKLHKNILRCTLVTVLPGFESLLESQIGPTLKKVFDSFKLIDD